MMNTICTIRRILILNLIIQKKENFKQIFSEKYNNVKTKYMDVSVKDLDRHKVATLIIISL